MESKLSIDTRRHNRHDRRNRDYDSGRSDSRDGSKRGSVSPPPSRVMKILAKNPQKQNQTQNTLTVNPSSAASQPIQIIQSHHQQQQSLSSALSSSAVSNNSDETIHDLTSNMPPVMKLIDGDTLSFIESASDYLFGETMSNGGFSVISSVGLQSVGKSSILNRIAGKDVFKTHKSTDNEDVLRHVTKGIDLHVTKERLLLLDSQPLLSASVLDDYLRLSSSSDITEPEIFSFMNSLQLLSFLFASCDYIIIVSKWMIDIHLLKLVSTSLMMVGEGTQKADIIWYFTEKDAKFDTNSIAALLGRGLSVSVICGNEIELLNAVMKSPSKRIVGDNGNTRNNVSEKSWLMSSQRIWDGSIRKSTLYTDYGRLLI